jgi:peptidoglycan hydrolase-like protein with peptidoglycan-binding domain
MLYCYRGEPTGYFDQDTEKAVKKFQRNQLIKPVNGVVTVVTRAELFALAAIVGGIDRGNYFLGDFSPAVIYIQELLRNSLCQLGIEDSVGVFGASTHEAVLEFQKEKNLEQDGIVGSNTKGALDDYRNKALNYLPLPPVPRRLFNKISDQVYDLVVRQKEGLENVIKQLDGIDSIDRALYGRSDRPLPQKFEVKEKIKRRLEPLTEVLIQLAPCLRDVTDLPAALEKGYKILEQVKVTTDKEDTQSLPKLKLLVDRLERSKGYVSSSIFRYRNYKLNDSGPAVIYIQERLRALGYYNAPTTGYFEQLTKEAVIQFQKQDMTDAVTANAGPPDGIFNLAAMTQLYGNSNTARETFQFLDPPISALLMEGIIRQFGGPEAVLAALITKDVKSSTQTVEGIQTIADKLSEELKSALPSDENKLKAAELSEIVANPNKSDLDKQEAVKQLILLIAKLAIKPVAQAIAQLVAPIGKYSDVERACEDGVRRFKVFANFSRVKEIDRILKGVSSWKFDELASWKFDELEPQLNQYEQLAETLATIQLEAKRYERALQIAGPNTNPIDLSRSLVVKAIKAIKPTPSAAPSSTLRKIQEFLIWQIYVNVRDYAKPPEDVQTIVNLLTNEPLQTKVVREQTFIRVVPSCSTCLLQVPVAGKLYKSISDSLKQLSSVYLVLPSAVDLSLWCSPVEDQGSLDACTAHAGVALVEYFQKKSSGNSINASRRFLYKRLVGK